MACVFSIMAGIILVFSRIDLSRNLEEYIMVEHVVDRSLLIEREVVAVRVVGVFVLVRLA